MTPVESTISYLLTLLTEAQEHPRKAVIKVLIAALLAAGTIGATSISTQLFTGLWQLAMERITFPMLQAEYDSVRRDYALTPSSQRQMLNATAAAINMRIRHEQSSNRQWFLIDWASTDRWNAVQPIDMNCGELP